MLLRQVLYRCLAGAGPFMMFKHPLMIPLTVHENSTWVNFHVDKETISTAINLAGNPKRWEPVPVDFLDGHGANHVLSLNMYHCTSPVFGDEPIVRAELNSYVQGADGTLGTLVLAYASDALSMDPDSLFTPRAPLCHFVTTRNRTRIGRVDTDTFEARFAYDVATNDREHDARLPPFDSTILEHTTITAYPRTRVHDTVLVDHSFFQRRHAASAVRGGKLRIPTLGINLTTPASVSWTKKPLRFVGYMWSNAEKEWF